MSQISTFYPKKTDDPYERKIFAKILFLPPTILSKAAEFKPHHLIDMPHIFTESQDNSEQNLHRCILIFFLKIFWVGPLLYLVILVPLISIKDRPTKIVVMFLKRNQDFRRFSGLYKGVWYNGSKF